MAIDFGRLARGVATGYLGAKIANTEANDRLKASIVQEAGLEFYNTTKPQFEEKERIRKDTYNKIATTYGKDTAEFMDYRGFITGDKNDFDTIVSTLGSKSKFDPGYVAKLKDYLARVQPGTYAERAESRSQTLQDKEKFIMDGLVNKGGFGVNTIKNQLDIGKEEKPAVTTEQPEVTTETGAKQPSTLYDIYGLKEEVEPMSESQYRLRLNDTLATAMQGYGLSGKYTRDAQGGIQLTSMEEIDQTAYQALNEMVANSYAANPERKDYINIANEAANFAKELSRASNSFNSNTTQYFNQNNIQTGAVGASNDESFNQWLTMNRALLETYSQSSPTIQNFIKSKYIQIQGDQGFQPFFDRYDDELSKFEE